MTPPTLGLGIGWRPEIDVSIELFDGLGFVEVVAESMPARGTLPRGLDRLRDRDVTVVPHGLTLSLGGADHPDRDRLRHLARLARRFDAPVVSDHLAFVEAVGLHSGHLLPVPRTWEALDVVVANVREAQAALDVPLALENIATLLDWPGAEMTEAEFLGELLARTGVRLLLDVGNLYANAVNIGTDIDATLDLLPLTSLAYVHVGGGAVIDGLYHDSHAHAVPDEVFDVLARLARRTTPPGVMLERDDDFPSDAALRSELDRIAATVAW